MIWALSHPSAILFHSKYRKIILKAPTTSSSLQETYPTQGWINRKWGNSSPFGICSANSLSPSQPIPPSCRESATTNATITTPHTRSGTPCPGPAKARQIYGSPSTTANSTWSTFHRNTPIISTASNINTFRRTWEQPGRIPTSNGSFWAYIGPSTLLWRWNTQTLQPWRFILKIWSISTRWISCRQATCMITRGAGPPTRASRTGRGPIRHTTSTLNIQSTWCRALPGPSSRANSSPPRLSGPPAPQSLMATEGSPSRAPACAISLSPFLGELLRINGISSKTRLSP